MDALLNEIAGKSHTGSPAVTPAIMGMNFQAVYTGESVSEPSVGNGGYQNAAALPSAELLQEIESVDISIGDIVNALKDRGIYDDTLIIITAKHGGSPIDPTRYVADGDQYAGHAAGHSHSLLGVAAEPDRNWRN